MNKTLSSVVNQTLKDIEIICVDDHSEDDSRRIIRKYEAMDSRIKVIYHKKNLSTSQSRKDGVLLSSGKYIMFLDGDDELKLNACETAYNAIEKYKTDMVQFGSLVINCAGMPQGRIDSNQRALKPYLKRIEEDSLISVCWQENLFKFQIWNKIFNGDICRKAFMQVEDGSFPKAQDLYAFFIIAYFSSSYMGISDCLYNYNFGLGVTGGNDISLEKFDILLSEKKVYDALCRFCKLQNIYEKFKPVLDEIKHRFLNECVSRWKDNLEPHNVTEGFNLLIDVWGFEDILCLLAEKYWYDRAMVAEKMLPVSFFNYRKRAEKKKLTIAYYYFSIFNGGAQRVAAELCNIWAEMTDEKGEPLYKVILITDNKALENDYTLNSTVKREFLPDSKASVKDNYSIRSSAWDDILDRNDIDIIVYGAWVSPCLLWDMLKVKGHPSKPAFILHCHSFTALPYKYENGTALELTYLYQMCDGTVVLSKTDKYFVCEFSRHTKCIVNPIGYLSESIETSDYEKNVIVWTGRISSEKNPLDLIYMMKQLVEKIPDAKLYIVGEGNEQLTANLVSTTKQMKLEENIIFTGFTEDVGAYYKKASLFICTSEYEGFSLTLAESLSYAVPVITYDLPWLTLIKAKKGVITVPYKRYDLLAEEAARLLTAPPEKIRKLGTAGQEYIYSLAHTDLGKEWSDFFNTIPEKKLISEKKSDTGILFEYISKWQQMPKTNLSKEKNKVRKLTDEKNSLTEKLRKADAKEGSLNAAVQKLNKEKNDLDKQLKIIEDENHTLSNEKNILKSKLKTTEDKIKLLEKQTAGSLSETENEAYILLYELEEALEQARQSKLKARELKKENERLQNELNKLMETQDV